jgi:hypothetical protein
MKLSSIKDCRNCSNSLVYGSPDDPTVECSSNDYVHQKCFIEGGRYCAGRCPGYTAVAKSADGRIEQNLALRFILAGNSEFILHSTKTNEDFKYKIKKKESLANENSFVYFVSIIKGHDSIYAGHLTFDESDNTFKFKQGNKGQIQANDLTIRSLVFVLNKLIRNETVGNLEVFHVGKCGKCGKKLTTPESILTGLGPQCCKKLGIPRIKL